MIAPSSGHSATVTLHLKIDNRSIPLTHLAHDFAILATDCDLAPGNAAIVMSIDGVVNEMHVRLPEGSRAGSRRISLALRAN